MADGDSVQSNGAEPQHEPSQQDAASSTTLLDGSAQTDTAVAATKPAAGVAKITETMSLLQFLADQKQRDSKIAMKKPKATMDDYKFWKTQPVRRTDETVVEEGTIEPDKPTEAIRQDSFSLLKDFEWVTIDLNDETQLKDVYQLLCTNYVEDDESTMRFNYSAEFIRWALMSPGWVKEWHVGVRAKTSGALVAFIAGIPIELMVHEKPLKMAEINFLCIHKKLRSKRLAPVLIKEVTRRINLSGIFQAAYTAGSFLPTPISSCRYYHRTLNAKKLVEVGFTSPPSGMTMQAFSRRFELPKETSIAGLRPFEPRDVPAVTVLLRNYLSRFEIRQCFSEEEVRHWMNPIDRVVYAYVVEDAAGEITDFVSYYLLSSTILGNPKHSHIDAAYLYYYASKNETTDAKRLNQLIKNAMILARNAGFDVFNCLALMDNPLFLDEQKFGRGSGTLYYYLYNYRCKDTDPSKLAFVLL
eukprot:jgi/Hompol1/6307/HPOL_002264-RA